MVLAAEGNTVEQLATSSRGPVIAVDLDDVLSQTNLAAAQCTQSSRKMMLQQATNPGQKGTTRRSAPIWIYRCFTVRSFSNCRGE